MEIRKIILTFLFIDFLFAIFIYLYGGNMWLLNSQIAFFSSIGVTLASFYSYQKMINAKIKENMVVEDRELLDTIDDKYELYEESELNKEDIKEVLKEEKEKNKSLKDSFNNLKLTSSAAFSLHRFLGYGFVLLGFFFLQKNSLFIMLPYLLGLIVVPFVATFSFLIIKK